LRDVSILRIRALLDKWKHVYVKPMYH